VSKFLRSLEEVRSALKKAGDSDSMRYPQTVLGWSADGWTNSSCTWGDRICDGSAGNSERKSYILPYLCACSMMRTVEPVISVYTAEELHLVETQGNKSLEPIKIDENEMFFDKTDKVFLDEKFSEMWSVYRWVMETSVRGVYLKYGLFGWTDRYLCRCLDCGTFSLVNAVLKGNKFNKQASTVDWHTREISADPIVNSKDGDVCYRYPNGKIRGRKSWC